MKKGISFIFYSIYVFLFVFFLLLFIEETPINRPPKMFRFREIFAVGWNFFTKNPRTIRLQIFFYKNNSWVELGKTGELKENITRMNDVVQNDIFTYANPAPDSLWKEYPSVEKCMSDSAFINPYKNYYLVPNKKFKGIWLSKKFLATTYGTYFLVVGSDKMPWAWLKDYSQMKMKCRSIIIKL